VIRRRIAIIAEDDSLQHAKNCAAIVLTENNENSKTEIRFEAGRPD
jgi:hypothetical protein